MLSALLLHFTFCYTFKRCSSICLTKKLKTAHGRTRMKNILLVWGCVVASEKGKLGTFKFFPCRLHYCVASHKANSYKPRSIRQHKCREQKIFSPPLCVSCLCLRGFLPWFETALSRNVQIFLYFQIRKSLFCIWRRTEKPFEAFFVDFRLNMHET